VRLRHDGLVVRQIDGEAVMLCLDTSTYFSTNATGALLVDRLTSDVERSDLVALLVDRHGVPVPEAEGDVDEFLAQLDAHGLLVDA
jgi:Coenzyme PQQ synthesis protein D (PqqD)